MLRRQHPWVREIQGKPHGEEYDLGISRRRRRRFVRRALLLLIGGAAFVEFAGVPYVRIDYGQPRVELRPLEPSLTARTVELVRSVSRSTQNRTEDETWDLIVIPRTSS